MAFLTINPTTHRTNNTSGMLMIDESPFSSSDSSTASDAALPEAILNPIKDVVSRCQTSLLSAG